MKRRRAAISMQMIARGFLIRRMTREIIQNRKNIRARRAGLRVIRKFIKQWHIKRQEKKLAAEVRKRKYTALKLIQWWTYGVAGRRMKRQGSAIMIQKHWRGYYCREFGDIHWYKKEQSERRVKAAGVICRYARKMVKRARDELNRVAKRRYDAASRIQGLARGCQGRKIAKEMRHEAKVEAAARLLSRALRSWLVRVRSRLKWLSRAEDEVRTAAKIVIRCLLWR
jgi:hypothetical protein